VPRIFYVDNNGKDHELWGHRLKEFGHAWAPPRNFWTPENNPRTHMTQEWHGACGVQDDWSLCPEKRVLCYLVSWSLRIDYFLYILCIRVDCLRVRSGPFFLPLSSEKATRKSPSFLGHKWCSLQVDELYYFIHDALGFPPSHACKLQNNQY
jgi:hypothetical protein